MVELVRVVALFGLRNVHIHLGLEFDGAKAAFQVAFSAREVHLFRLLESCFHELLVVQGVGKELILADAVLIVAHLILVVAKSVLL